MTKEKGLIMAHYRKVDHPAEEKQQFAKLLSNKKGD